MVKRTKLDEFKVQRYTKPITCMKLKDNDEVVKVTDSIGTEVFITTKNGYGLRYNVDEISVVGLRASGVKAISLKNDEVVTASIFNDNIEYLTVITDKGTGKRIKMSEFEPISRAKKGVLMVRDVKTNPYKIVNTFLVSNKHNLLVKVGNDFLNIKLTELPITDRYSTGSQITKGKVVECFLKEDLTKDEPVIEEKPIEEKKEEINLESIDKKILTIDDFLDDFKF